MSRIPVAETLTERRVLSSQCVTCQAAASMPGADCHHGNVWNVVFIALSLARSNACQWRSHEPAGVPTAAPAADPEGEAVSVTTSSEVKSPTSPPTRPGLEWVGSTVRFTGPPEGLLRLRPSPSNGIVLVPETCHDNTVRFTGPLQGLVWLR